MRALLIAAALLATPVVAQESEWKYIDSDVDRTDWYIHTPSWLAGNSRSRSAKMWIMMDGSRDATVPWRLAKELYMVDCVSDLYRYEQGTYYYRDSDVRTLGRKDGSRHPTPGTVLAEAMKMLCADPDPDLATYQARHRMKEAA